MPSSRWQGKKWPVEKFFEALKALNILPVILGSPSDSESRALLSRLEQQKIECVSMVGTWSLRDVAKVLSGARLILETIRDLRIWPKRWEFPRWSFSDRLEKIWDSVPGERPADLWAHRFGAGHAEKMDAIVSVPAISSNA